MTTDPIAARIRAFATLMENAMAQETIVWEHGVAHFHSLYPTKYALNYLRLDGPGELTVDELIAHAEEIMGARQLGHRRVNGWGDNGGPFYEEMGEKGWTRDRLNVMAHGGEIHTRPLVEVVELSFEEIMPAMIAFDSSEDRNPTDIAVQLVESRAAVMQAVDTTFLAARVDDQIEGWCELYLGDGIAQVENVMTFPEFRNRGIASSVVNEASRRAYSGGAEIVFLFADADDWPKGLYEKLGFTVVDNFWEYTQPHDS